MKQKAILKTNKIKLMKHNLTFSFYGLTIVLCKVFAIKQKEFKKKTGKQKNSKKKCDKGNEDSIFFLYTYTQYILSHTQNAVHVFKYNMYMRLSRVLHRYFLCSFAINMSLKSFVSVYLPQIRFELFICIVYT